MVDGILCNDKPSKGLGSRMRQLRSGGRENQKDDEMKMLNTSKKENSEELQYKYNSKLRGSWD